MVFVSFIFSVVFLSLFVSLKVWENKTNKRLIPAKIIKRSDAFIERGICYFDYYYNKSNEGMLRIPVMVGKITMGLIEHVGEHKDLVKKKISKSLNSDKKLDVPKTSVFLRNMEKKDLEN